MAPTESPPVTVSRLRVLRVLLLPGHARARTVVRLRDDHDASTVPTLPDG